MSTSQKDEDDPHRAAQHHNSATEQAPVKEQNLSYTEALEQFHPIHDRDLQFLGRPCLNDIENRQYARSELACIAEIKRRYAEDVAKETEVRKLEAAAAVKAKKKADQARQKEFMAAGQNLKSKIAAFRPSSDCHLPEDVWITILKLLCNDIEFDGVKGPSVIARDLCNVRSVNKELYRASAPALQHLNTICSSIKNKVTGKLRSISQRQDLMQPLISDPGSLSKSDLETLSSSINLNSKTRATMAMDLFRAIGLKFHTCCPAHLVFMVLAERSEQVPELEALVDKVKAGQNHGLPRQGWWCRNYRNFKYAFEARVECMKLGLTTMDALKAAAAEAEKRLPALPSDSKPTRIGKLKPARRNLFYLGF